MWHAGLMGGGDDWYNVVLVTAPVGSEIEFDDGDEVVTAIGTGSQQAIAIHDPSSTYNITVSVNGYQETDTVTSTAVSGTVFIKEFKFAKITLTFDDDFRGLAVTLTDGTHVASPAPTLPATGNTADFYVPYYEVTYTFSATVSGILYTSKGVYVDSLDDECTEILQVRPNGKTVTPTDDIQTWLECAGINKPYTTLDEVLGDHESLQILMTDHNAVDYMVRSKTWITKNGLVPAMTDATHPSGEVSASSNSSNNEPYKAFDGIDSSSSHWIPGQNASPVNTYIQYAFDEPKIVKQVKLIACAAGLSAIIKYQGSNTGNTDDWTDITDLDGNTNIYIPQSVASSQTWLTNTTETSLNNDTAYKYYRLQFVSCTASSLYDGFYTLFGINKLQFYSLDVDHGITEDETAMRYIGRRNYASDRLLGLDNPGLVPVMTDDTHPEGEVIYSSYLALQEWSFYPYFAFDKMYGENNWNNRWVSTLNEAGYIGYKFTSPKCIKAVSILQDSKEAHTVYDVGDGLDVTLQYHDGTNWVDVQNIIDSSSNISEMKFYPINNEISATDWRIKFNSTNIHDRTTLEGYSIVTELQFYDKDDPVYIEWSDAVCDSEYFESVLNAKNPTMTSATTPEGQAIRSSIYNNNANYEAWRAIGDPSAGGWSPNSNDSVNNCYIGYKFTSPKCIRKIKFTTGIQSGVSWNFAVQGSNNGSDWTTIGSGFAAYANGLVNKFNIDNNDEYLYYRILVIYFTGYGYINCVDIRSLNFYARIDVDETKVMLYGANQDSFYYKDAGQQDVPLTTLSTTEKEISKSDLPLGEFKLYSSVAKNPDDLTADFCKTFKNDDNLIEVMMRPENALYWYGWKLDDFTNPGSVQSGYSNLGQGFEFNTQNALLKDSASSKSTRCSICNTPLKGNIKRAFVVYGSTTKERMMTQVNESYKDKVFYGVGWSWRTYESSAIQQFPSLWKNNTADANNAVVDHTNFRFTTAGDKTIHAFWASAPNPACNLFSAAKDVVYYTENGVDIVVAETDEFGGAIVDFSKIPTGVTLYSSVAKDPSDPNLADPYSKTFSPVNGRFWLMPDNTLYWYGYMSENCEIMSSANGWDHGAMTFDNPVFNINYYKVSVATNHLGGLGTKKAVNVTKSYLIGKGITYQSSNAGFLRTGDDKSNSHLDMSENITSSSLQKITNTVSGTKIVLAFTQGNSSGSRECDFYAFWYE